MRLRVQPFAVRRGAVTVRALYAGYTRPPIMSACLPRRANRGRWIDVHDPNPLEQDYHGAMLRQIALSIFAASAAGAGCLVTIDESRLHGEGGSGGAGAAVSST